MADLALIEDDKRLTALLGSYLSSRGYSVKVAHDGISGMRLVYSSHPNLVILDLNLPGHSGWEVLERIREMSDVPVIILTSQNEEESEVRGFAQGADDFVAKPFSFAALAARIAAVLNRTRDTGAAAQAQLAHGELRVDLVTKRLWSNHKQIPLTPTEYKLLVALMQQAGKVVLLEDLIRETWGEDYLDDVGYVRRYVRSLRIKLEPAGSTFSYIHNVRGFGYRFQATNNLTAD